MRDPGMRTACLPSTDPGITQLRRSGRSGAAAVSQPHRDQYGLGRTPNSTGSTTGMGQPPELRQWIPGSFRPTSTSQKYKRKKRNGPRGRLGVVKPDDTPAAVEQQRGRRTRFAQCHRGREIARGPGSGDERLAVEPGIHLQVDQSKGDNPGHLIPGMFEDIPLCLARGKPLEEQGAGRAVVKGWGGTPVEAQRIAMPWYHVSPHDIPRRH